MGTAVQIGGQDGILEELQGFENFLARRRERRFRGKIIILCHVDAFNRSKLSITVPSFALSFFFAVS